MLDKLKQLDEAAESLADASDSLAKSWKSLFITSGIVAWLGVVGTFVYSLWEGRAKVAADLYSVFTGGLDHEQGDFSEYYNEWNQTPPDEFPEFWVCERGKCQPDLVKREQVLDTLNQLRVDLGAVRSTFSVYSATSRLLVAQTQSVNLEPLDSGYWSVPLVQDGYDDNILAHLKGECNRISTRELESGSIIAVGKGTTLYILSCPVNGQLDLRGYVAVDFDKTVSDQLQQESYATLSKAAQNIQDIMSFQR